MRKEKTQYNDVLQYLKIHGSITSMEAWSKFHITRLSARIHVLRKLGYNIKTDSRSGVNEYGVYTYAVYKLVEEKL